MKACRHNLFSRFFYNSWILYVESFKIVGQVVPVFWPETSKKSYFHLNKYSLAKYCFFFHLFKQESPVFVLNWAQKILYF